MTAASAALHISDIPWAGPFAGVRVARVNGELIAFPTFEQQAKSDIDLVVACSKDAIVMVEGGAAEATENDVIDALMFAHRRRSRSSSSSSGCAPRSASPSDVREEELPPGVAKRVAGDLRRRGS
jgi:polyribonucleotide nucleotidyltransferase